MLFEGQGNAEERPEYQIMIKRKGSHCTSFILLPFSVIIIRQTSGVWGLVSNYLILYFFVILVFINFF